MPLEARREPASETPDLFVAERSGPESIVVHQEFAVGSGQILEEVDERRAAHL